MEPDLLPYHSFENVLRKHNVALNRERINVLQVNIGNRCNQRCFHCHVNGGPDRLENMDRRTVNRLLELLADEPTIQTVDITGGAPELNPNFRYFVSELRSLNKTIIDRCNLTVYFEPGQEDTPQFLAAHRVQVTASLPCYLEDNVNKQRGEGVYNKSIKALRILNQLGYGIEGTGLILNLVYNPAGSYLPPDQTELESDYKIYLKDAFGIEFNRLFALTNIPVKRFADHLQHKGLLENYLQLLSDNFNPMAAANVMCRRMISVGWNGKLYDCDFNRALEIPVSGRSRTIWDIRGFDALGSEIIFGNHCFGCTAGAGSSCGGSLT